MSKENEGVVVVDEAYDLNAYQVQAYSLAVYGEPKIAYPALGLVEEVGELLECSPEHPESIVKEMGDVMWYCGALASDLGFTLVDARMDCKVQLIPDIEALYKNAFKIAGRVKKVLRGDSGQESKVEEIKGRVGDIIRRIEVLAAQHGSSLGEVCERNLDKLFDRKDRGVLKGDGDNR